MRRAVLHREVHRFGITFHRQKRSKGTFTGELEKIPGIGKQTSEELLKKFRSVSKISKLSLRELGAELGMTRARKVFAYFHEDQGPSQQNDQPGPADGPAEDAS